MINVFLVKMYVSSVISIADFLFPKKAEMPKLFKYRYNLIYT